MSGCNCDNWDCFECNLLMCRNCHNYFTECDCGENCPCGNCSILKEVRELTEFETIKRQLEFLEEKLEALDCKYCGCKYGVHTFSMLTGKSLNCMNHPNTLNGDKYCPGFNSL
jgi:hypothetical protein